MKRLLSLMLAASIVFTATVNIYAGDVITIVDDTANQSSETAADNSSQPSAEAEQTENVAVQSTVELTPATTYLALGADLTESQKATVLSLMGITPEKLQNYNVVYVTNAEEHAYLDSYIDSAVIGKRSLSSVMVRPQSTGHGVTVNTQNINYCTPAMYQNALITAGVTDADVLVVGPSPISGTAALIGALKAYSEMSGKAVNEKALDTALDELVTTGDVSTAIGDDEKAAELISYIKAQIAANDLNTREEIEAAVRKGNAELNANLSEEQIIQIVDVMVKIKAMGIDFDVLAEQAESLYAKYGEQIKAGTFNINDIDLADLGVGKIVSNAIGNFFTSVGDTFKSFFGGFFGKKK